MYHHFNFSKQTPQNRNEAGTRIIANSDNFPILKGMSLYKLTLKPRALREPHWHPNADELGYCLKGELLITFYHTDDLLQTFLVKAGEMFFIPSGALHYLVNVGEGDAELLVEFSHENPEEFNLSSSLGAFTNAVLGNTWGVPEEYFKKLNRPLQDRFAVLAPKAPIPESALYTTPYRYNIEGSTPPLQTAGGSARMAKQSKWPILKKQALYSLILTKGGMREPHWHPETAEMGYVQAGTGRMTVLSPDGDKDTYLLEPGDLYFIPKAYPHHIETLSDQPLHFLIFFDQSMPEDIGFTGSIKSFPNEALGAVLDVEPSFFDQLHKYYNDLFIVDKINPEDPH